HLIGLSHADLAAQSARLSVAGFAMQPLVQLRRWKDTPQGRKQLAFDVLRTRPGVMAEGRVQWSLSRTPELAWLPGTTEHPNAADALTDVLICVADPAEAAERYARYTGRAARSAAGLAVLDLD